MVEAIGSETSDFKEFKKRVKQKTGIDLNLYKQQQMHRRLLSLLECVQVTNFADYFALLERNPDEWQVFLDRMTINVSELFRNPEKWEELRQLLLTQGLTNTGSVRQQHPHYKAWSAGCSYGAEPYSLALLLDQIAPNRRHTLHATDLDRTILGRARKGCFTLGDVKNVAPALLERYFTRINSGAGPRTPAENQPAGPGNGGSRSELERASASLYPVYQMCEEVRARVTFKPHNLLADRFDEGYDLICCRNVVIYFTDHAKEALYRRFYHALKPGGILFVGGTERLFESRELGFEMPVPCFYRRILE